VEDIHAICVWVLDGSTGQYNVPATLPQEKSLLYPLNINLGILECLFGSSEIVRSSLHCRCLTTIVAQLQHGLSTLVTSSVINQRIIIELKVKNN